MKKLIFITGGARSGKSQFALSLAKKAGRSRGKVLFVATCTARDAEMKKRVREHQKNRPASWETLEAQENLLKTLRGIKKIPAVLIIDCLTLFVAELLIKNLSEKTIKKKIKEIAAFLSEYPGKAIIVSNEVGSGIVPDNKLSRQFRDLAGSANQTISKHADEVYYLVSGIPLKIKGGKSALIKKSN